MATSGPAENWKILRVKHDEKTVGNFLGSAQVLRRMDGMGHKASKGLNSFELTGASIEDYRKIAIHR
jgi:hypothetical protein